MKNFTMKISSRRLADRLEEFKYNYNHHARDLFHGLPDNIRYELLNEEFAHDKKIMCLLFDRCRHSLLKKMIRYDSHYLYTTDYKSLSDEGNKIHIRHNAYRTISAYLLYDCSLKEKAIVLSKSLDKKVINDKHAIKICIERLTALEEFLTLNKNQ